MPLLQRSYGIGRSLAMYHGRPWRVRHQTALYGQFLRQGDLAFDIGAHVGSRVRAWRRLGVRVVAVEPQPDCLRVLRLIFGRDPEVRIEPAAVGALPGRARLAVSTASPTVSTLSIDWIRTVTADRSFDGVRWDASVEVDVTTLDALVDRYGPPAFCKIDVEGFEDAVLAGLSRPLRALSFEVLPQAYDAGLAALARLEALGSYEYNYSPVETMRLTSLSWMDADALRRLLAGFRPTNRSGDVYARIKSS